MPDIKVKGKIQNLEKEEKNKKPIHSNFLLTINTNQQYKSNDEHLQNDIEFFENTIKNILNNIDQYIDIRNDGDIWDDDTIKDVDVDYIIERGTKKGQIHCHALIKIKHFTRLQLDYKKLKEKVKKDLGLKNIYLNNRLVRNSGSENIVEYLNKYV
jgi:hypothetical protein